VKGVVSKILEKGGMRLVYTTSSFFGTGSIEDKDPWHSASEAVSSEREAELICRSSICC
jgi:hypothetical protein